MVDVGLGRVEEDGVRLHVVRELLWQHVVHPNLSRELASPRLAFSNSVLLEDPGELGRGGLLMLVGGRAATGPCPRRGHHILVSLGVGVIIRHGCRTRRSERGLRQEQARPAIGLFESRHETVKSKVCLGPRFVKFQLSMFGSKAKVWYFIPSALSRFTSRTPE